MKHNFKYARLVALALCVCLLLPLGGCAGDEPVQKQIFAMDTVMNITAYGKDAKAGIDAAVGVINSLDDVLDPNNEGSYTYQINHAEGHDVVVTPQVNEMLTTALSVYALSGGALDLSVYPLYEAWGEFKDETGTVPSDDTIKELRKNLGFGKTEITDFDGEGNFSVRMPAGTQISFGSVAKGCASKYAIDALRKSGVESGIVSLGGNVQTLGTKPDGSNWTVAVEDPNNPGSYVGTLSVGETAIITSGSYQRYFTAADGTKYHHIIDPSTGYPADNDLLSVTIVCKDGTLADCLSTAMFVLGQSAALNYWRNNGGFDMIMITKDNKVLCTTGLLEVFSLTNKTDYTLKMVE